MQEAHRKLLNYIKKHDLEKEGVHYSSILGMFSYLYASHNFFDSDFMQEKLEKIECYLSAVSEEDKKALIIQLRSICAENEALALEEGMWIGFRLAEELREVTFD